MATKCTASSEVRTWTREAWVQGQGYCPDCGALVDVWVRGSDLAPRAKARAHQAPEGVTPEPYGVHPNGGPA
jgi:hypothetical protein